MLLLLFFLLSPSYCLASEPSLLKKKVEPSLLHDTDQTQTQTQTLTHNKPKQTYKLTPKIPRKPKNK
jgi:hypothetical protein